MVAAAAVERTHFRPAVQVFFRDLPRVDLAYTWRLPPMYPGAPGLAASASSSCQAGKAQPHRSTGPGHRPPAAPPPAPPGGQPRHQPKPPAIFRVTIRCPQLRHPQAPAISDLDPDHAVCGPDHDRDRLPRSARAALPDTVPEQLTSSSASAPHGWPGPSTPATNARATRARSACPASVAVSRTARPAISAPTFPAALAPGKSRGPPGGHTGMHARLGGTRQAETRPQAGHLHPVKRLLTPLPGPTALLGDTSRDREERPASRELKLG
jgi:hypothetical protein